MVTKHFVTKFLWYGCWGGCIPSIPNGVSAPDAGKLSTHEAAVAVRIVSMYERALCNPLERASWYRYPPPSPARPPALDPRRNLVAQ